MSLNSALNGNTNVIKKGMALYRAGRYREASGLCSRVLRSDPTHADALHLSGVLARQSGNLTESEDLICRAISSYSFKGLYHRDLGETSWLLGKQSEAVQSYHDAISLDPNDLDTTQRLAQILHEKGELDEAGRLYQRVVEKHPDAVEAHYNLGRIRRRCGHIDAAVECYRSAASLRPASPDIHFNLAAVLYDSGQFVESARSYQKVISLQPGDAEAHYSLGVVLQELGDFNSATDSYLRALALKPAFPNALSNLGSTYMELGDLESAEDYLRQCIAIAPQNVNAHCNLGNVLQKKGETLSAIESFRNALTLDPRHVSTLCNFGFVLDFLGEIDGAAQCYQLALAIEPGYDLARFSISTHLLASGDLASGWREYEARWGTREFRAAKRNFTQPQWHGEAIRGSRIFIYSEQGFGDTLQFVRFVLMVANLGAEVVFEVQPSLFRLLSNLHPSVRVLSAGTALDDVAFDWQCPLLSLPLALSIELSNIPTTIPYLRPEPSETRHWNARLAADGLRIGLVWSGNPKHTRDSQRSISLDRLLPLIGSHRATFYCLQKGPAAQQCASISVALQMVNLDEHIRDFADTAAIVANLDLLISVDTAVAHLAAAMGKPVWILLHNAPDWRWLRNRTDSPWYPTVRLFRQSKAGDWDGVLRQVQHELADLIQAYIEKSVL